MYIQRTIEKEIQTVGESFPCIAVYGPRQVGKSTTIDHLFGNKFKKVTLDDMDDANLANSNPKLFLEMNQWPIILDEIQKAPGLLNEIKIKIDEQRLLWLKADEKQQLMYVLTGSSRFELQQGISESLAGRCGLIDMASFSQVEKYQVGASLFNPDIRNLIKREKTSSQKYRTKMQIFNDIYQGGMPDICTGRTERYIYFKSYVSTYIEKDVRKLISASSEIQFRNFLSIIALRTVQELHYDEIANSVGIDARTCRKWISVLETSGIIYLLQPFMANFSKRIIKAPKIYFMDTGLCSYLCKWPNAEMLESCAMSGAFFETYVVSELIKNMYAFGKSPNTLLYYYRDTNQKEIDLIYYYENQLYPIEIKKNVSPSKPTKNFSVLNKYGCKVMPGLVIDCGEKIRAINESAYEYPVFLLGE